ncbi:MAG: ion transporter [Bacteroidales bacterium]|nr:ion transporter [Bacteroidales bacterium]
MNLFINKKDHNTPTRFISAVIILSIVIIYIQESGYYKNLALNIADKICTFIFVIEMFVKFHEQGLKGYFRSHWNQMDFILVILSLPSLLIFFIDFGSLDLSYLLVLRILRVFRITRILKMFPNRDIKQLGINIKIAFKDSFVVFVGFFLLIVTFSLISCALFREAAPDLYGTPTEGIYTTFRLFTIEGWYDIPEEIAQNLSPGIGRLVRIYFSIVVIIGGVIGLSLVNSIFTDAMVSDNNNTVERKIDATTGKIDALIAEIESLKEEITQLKQDKKQ